MCNVIITSCSPALRSSRHDWTLCILLCRSITLYIAIEFRTTIYAALLQAPGHYWSALLNIDPPCPLNPNGIAFVMGMQLRCTFVRNCYFAFSRNRICRTCSLLLLIALLGHNTCAQRLPR